MINKNQTASVHVTVQIPGSQGPASVARLQAPSLTAMTGIHFAGRTFDNSTDGKPQGTETFDMVDGQNGSYAFDMPALTGAVVVAHP